MKLLFILWFLTTPALSSSQLAGPAQGRLDRIPAVSSAQSLQEYRIGRDDLIEITVFEVPALHASVRVSASGLISLPLIGTLQAAGMTPQELENLIEERLRGGYLNDPQTAVFIREYASQPVSIMGAVKSPGIYQIKGQKSLLEMLTMAQGLDANAGKIIQVMRRSYSQNQAADSEQQISTPTSQIITIDTDQLFQEGKTELNVPIYADDVINVLQAGSIFVVGEVMRPGEFVLRNGKEVTVTQAVALGSGFSKEAKKKECIIIRYKPDGAREEIVVNVGKILQGDASDVRMRSNDILFVPANKVKSAASRALDSVIAVAIGRAVYIR